MKTLSVVRDIKIRFNEIDALGIVWHGHYIRFFEEGREAFGEKHGLTYLDIQKMGFVVPVVDISCEYKRPLTYGDSAILETTFENNPAAKLCFRYRILSGENGEVIATGSSTQVFLDDKERQLQLMAPAFFSEWKKRNNL